MSQVHLVTRKRQNRPPRTGQVRLPRSSEDVSSPESREAANTGLRRLTVRFTRRFDWRYSAA
jgi:hypothetical protein